MQERCQLQIGTLSTCACWATAEDWVMAVFTIALFACLIMDAPHTYGEWKAIFSGTLMRLVTTLFFASLLYHAWVGMRDILMDYLHATSIRLTAQAAVGFALIFYSIWAVSILWGH